MWFLHEMCGALFELIITFYDQTCEKYSVVNQSGIIENFKTSGTQYIVLFGCHTNYFDHFLKRVLVYVLQSLIRTFRSRKRESNFCTRQFIDRTNIVLTKSSFFQTLFFKKGEDNGEMREQNEK